MRRLAVIGGGAAGFMGAIEAARTAMRLKTKVGGEGRRGAGLGSVTNRVRLCLAAVGNHFGRHLVRAKKGQDLGRRAMQCHA